MPKRTWKRVRPVTVSGDDCLIELADGSTAYVDAEDRHKVESNNWSIGNHCVVSGLGSLQNIILGERLGFIVDHIDGDVRNNRKANLRHVTKAENCWNRRIAANNTTGFKGVCPRKDRGTFLAGINIQGRRVKLGTFRTAELAARAYDDAARAHYGPHACVNFPKKGEQSAHRGKAVVA